MGILVSVLVGCAGAIELLSCLHYISDEWLLQQLRTANHGQIKSALTKYQDEIRESLAQLERKKSQAQDDEQNKEEIEELKKKFQERLKEIWTRERGESAERNLQNIEEIVEASFAEESKVNHKISENHQQNLEIHENHFDLNKETNDHVQCTLENSIANHITSNNINQNFIDSKKDYINEITSSNQDDYHNPTEGLIKEEYNTIHNEEKFNQDLIDSEKDYINEIASSNHHNLIKEENDSIPNQANFNQDVIDSETDYMIPTSFNETEQIENIVFNDSIEKDNLSSICEKQQGTTHNDCEIDHMISTSPNQSEHIENIIINESIEKENISLINQEPHENDIATKSNINQDFIDNEKDHMISTSFNQTEQFQNDSIENKNEFSQNDIQGQFNINQDFIDNESSNHPEYHSSSENIVINDLSSFTENGLFESNILLSETIESNDVIKNSMNDLEVVNEETESSKALSLKDEEISNQLENVQNAETIKNNNECSNMIENSEFSEEILLDEFIDKKFKDNLSNEDESEKSQNLHFDEISMPSHYTDEYLRSLDGVPNRPLVRDDGARRRRLFKKRNSSHEEKLSREEEVNAFTALEEAEFAQKSNYAPIKYSSEPSLKTIGVNEDAKIKRYKSHNNELKNQSNSNLIDFKLELREDEEEEDVKETEDLKQAEIKSESSYSRVSSMEILEKPGGEDVTYPWGDIKPETRRDSDVWIKMAKESSIDEGPELTENSEPNTSTKPTNVSIIINQTPGSIALSNSNIINISQTINDEKLCEISNRLQKIEQEIDEKISVWSDSAYTNQNLTHTNHYKHHDDYHDYYLSDDEPFYGCERFKRPTKSFHNQIEQLELDFQKVLEDNDIELNEDSSYLPEIFNYKDFRHFDSDEEPSELSDSDDEAPNEPDVEIKIHVNRHKKHKKHERIFKITQEYSDEEPSYPINQIKGVAKTIKKKKKSRLVGIIHRNLDMYDELSDSKENLITHIQKLGNERDFICDSDDEPNERFFKSTKNIEIKAKHPNHKEIAKVILDSDDEPMRVLNTSKGAIPKTKSNKIIPTLGNVRSYMYDSDEEPSYNIKRIICDDENSINPSDHYMESKYDSESRRKELMKLYDEYDIDESDEFGYFPHIESRIYFLESDEEPSYDNYDLKRMERERAHRSRSPSRSPPICDYTQNFISLEKEMEEEDRILRAHSSSPMPSKVNLEEINVEHNSKKKRKYKWEETVSSSINTYKRTEHEINPTTEDLNKPDYDNDDDDDCDDDNMNWVSDTDDTLKTVIENKKYFKLDESSDPENEISELKDEIAEDLIKNPIKQSSIEEFEWNFSENEKKDEHQSSSSLRHTSKILDFEKENLIEKDNFEIQSKNDEKTTQNQMKTKEKKKKIKKKLKSKKDKEKDEKDSDENQENELKNLIKLEDKKFAEFSSLVNTDLDEKDDKFMDEGSKDVPEACELNKMEELKELPCDTSPSSSKQTSDHRKSIPKPDPLYLTKESMYPFY